MTEDNTRHSAAAVARKREQDRGSTGENSRKITLPKGSFETIKIVRQRARRPWRALRRQNDVDMARQGKALEAIVCWLRAEFGGRRSIDELTLSSPV